MRLQYQSAFQVHLGAQPSEVETWTVEQFDVAVYAVDKIQADIENSRRR